MAEDLSFSTRIRMTLTKMTMLIWKRNMHSGPNGKIRYTLVKTHSVLSQGNEKFKNPVSSQDKDDYYWTRDKSKWTTMCHCKREHSLRWWAKCVWGKKSKYRKKIQCSGLVDYVFIIFITVIFQDSECIQNSVASHNAKRKEFREAFSSILQRTPGNRLEVGSDPHYKPLWSLSGSGPSPEKIQVSKQPRLTEILPWLPAMFISTNSLK